jgi:hypothetical protein
MIAALALAACTSRPTPQPTAAPPAFVSVTVTGVGTIQRGGSSGDTLALSFNEAGVAAIARGPGSFQVTLSDNAGFDSTVSFLGTPSTAKSPGSLGASATVSGNVLTVRILDSDTVNIEPIIVTGVGIAASSTAALGSIEATMGGFTGSLAGGATNDVLVSPGSVLLLPLELDSLDLRPGDVVRRWRLDGQARWIL